MDANLRAQTQGPPCILFGTRKGYSYEKIGPLCYKSPTEAKRRRTCHPLRTLLGVQSLGFTVQGSCRLSGTWKLQPPRAKCATWVLWRYGHEPPSPNTGAALYTVWNQKRTLLRKMGSRYVTKVLQKPSEGELAIPFALFLETGDLSTRNRDAHKKPKT